MTEKVSLPPAGTRLSLLSYNVQVGIFSHKPHHYLTRSWRHVLPHTRHLGNLDRIAEVVSQFDVVALQEVDAGSLRSQYINQTEYLADQARFPYWYHQTNRRLGHLAQHSNGLLSQYMPAEITEHRLPGRLPGRGAMMARYGTPENSLVLVMLHLALGKQSRMQQLDYVSRIVHEYEHVVVMGDMNCQPDSEELSRLLDRCGLREPDASLATFPSWKPTRKLDHILVSESLEVENVRVLDVNYSDHLPIALDVVVPEAVSLAA